MGAWIGSSYRFAPVSGGNDAFTAMLLHCDGANASTTFTDSSVVPKTMSVSSGAKIATAQSKFGGACADLTASGATLVTSDHADFDFGTGDFVIDFWLRLNSLSLPGTDANRILWLYRQVHNINNTQFNFFLDYRSGFTDITFSCALNGVLVANGYAPNGMVINTWYHIALVRSGPAIRAFKNGVMYTWNPADVMEIGANAVPNTASSLFIGPNSSSFMPTGYLDEFRISKGTDRGWGGGFTPPTAPYG